MTKPSDNTPILELRNLGPSSANQLAEVGIRTAGDIRALGVEETFERMMRGRIERGEGGKCFNAAYLYALYGALNDIDWRAVPEAKRAEFKALTAELRAAFA